jgi:hypothetical protein
MTVQELVQKIQEATDRMAKTLGADPSQHGTLRGTYEAALAEAQGAELIKAHDFTPAKQSWKHYINMRDAANSLANNLKIFNDSIKALRAIDPKAARVADETFQPLTSTASIRLDIARKTEQLIIEIAQTRNTARLEGVPLNQSRDAAGLVSNQLRQMNMNVVPQGLAQGSRGLMERIRILPTTLEEARDQIRQIASMIGTMAAAAARAATSAASRAVTAVTEMLISWSSRFSVFLPPIPLKLVYPDPPGKCFEIIWPLGWFSAGSLGKSVGRQSIRCCLVTRCSGENWKVGPASVNSVVLMHCHQFRGARRTDAN